LSPPFSPFSLALRLRRAMMAIGTRAIKACAK
jgi:hypothetical protein